MKGLILRVALSEDSGTVTREGVGGGSVSLGQWISVLGGIIDHFHFFSLSHDHVGSFVLLCAPT